MATAYYRKVQLARRPPEPQISFHDRRQAGAHLAVRLAAYRTSDTLVLAIPRGGIPVAAEVARQLEADLDVVARKPDVPPQGEPAIGSEALPSMVGRTVILVDDGMATGATMRAAMRSVRERSPARLIVAVPVGSMQACADLRAECDEVVCLAMPEPFGAISSYYRVPAAPSDIAVLSSPH
jgi:putative phosphoribosyl transferase